MSKRNILNLKDVDSFISVLAKENPAYDRYIKSVVKNYIVRKGPAVRNWMFRFKRDKNWMEQQIMENGGPFYNIVLDESMRISVIKVLDYLRGNNFSPTTSIDFEDALKQHEQWIVDLNKEKKEPKTPEVKESEVSTKAPADKTTSAEEKVIDFDGGFYIVKLINKKDFETEGRKMQHCVGAYDPATRDIYSLRSSNGTPLVTIEVKDSIVQQALAQKNLPVPKEHIPMLNEFAEKNNLKFRKVVYSPGAEPLTAIIIPALATFLAFKWKIVLTWFMLDADPDISKMLFEGLMSNALSLGFGIFAFMKWIDYFMNFNPSSSTTTIVDKL